MTNIETKFNPATGGNITQVIDSETVVLTVKRKKSSLAKGFGKLIAFIIGGTGILFSALLFITIIGILPAIGLFFMSLGIIYLGLGKQRVKCPHCQKKQPVVNTAENFSCPKCRKLTVLNWH
jgi:hypothetical protein